MTFTEGSNSTLAKENIPSNGVSVAADFDVKARFGQDIRRFTLPSDVRLGQLEAHIRTLFSVASPSPLVMLYQDDENDLVTMTLDEELKYAVSKSDRLLRLEVRIQGQSQAPVAAPVEAETKPWKRHHKEQQIRANFGMGPSTPGEWTGRGRRCPRPAPETYVTSPAEVTTPLQPAVEAIVQPDVVRGRGPRECPDKLKARHVKDVTVADGTIIQPGVPFVKTWRIRNAGTVNWPEKTRMIFISHKGDHMGGPEFVCIPGVVQAGAEVDVSVNFVAPQEPGDYSGFWRMCTEDSKKFGQRFWVSITVAKPKEGGDSSSSENSGLEQVPVPSDYERFVKQIQDMGFTDISKRRIERLLCKFGGNVDTVVAKLNASREKINKNKLARASGKKH